MADSTDKSQTDGRKPNASRKNGQNGKNTTAKRLGVERGAEPKKAVYEPKKPIKKEENEDPTESEPEDMEIDPKSDDEPPKNDEEKVDNKAPKNDGEKMDNKVPQNDGEVTEAKPPAENTETTNDKTNQNHKHADVSGNGQAKTPIDSIEPNDRLNAGGKPIVEKDLHGEPELQTSNKSESFPGLTGESVAIVKRYGTNMYVTRYGPSARPWFKFTDNPYVSENSPNLPVISAPMARKLDCPTDLEGKSIINGSDGRPAQAEKKNKHQILGVLGLVWDTDEALPIEACEDLNPDVVNPKDRDPNQTRKKYPTCYVLVKWIDGEKSWELSSVYRAAYGKHNMREKENMLYEKAKKQAVAFTYYYQNTTTVKDTDRKASVFARKPPLPTASYKSPTPNRSPSLEPDNNAAAARNINAVTTDAGGQSSHQEVPATTSSPATNATVDNQNPLAALDPFNQKMTRSGYKMWLEETKVKIPALYAVFEKLSLDEGAAKWLKASEPGT